MKSFIKNNISRNNIEKIRYGLRWPVIKLEWVLSKSNLLTALYYFVRPSFRMEELSVLRGKVAYNKKLKSENNSSSLIRRNIHRLEKGLIMRPRKEIFGDEFVLVTVKALVETDLNSLLDDNERKWAVDVLNEYFSVVGNTKNIDQAKLLFQSYIRSKANLEINNINCKYIPYEHNELPQVKLSIADLEELYLKRRSVRWYERKEVPVTLIERAVGLATYAPSACNRQPYRFEFYNSFEKASKIARCAGGTGGFNDNIPSIIVVIGDLSSYEFERDRHLIYIDSSLAVMQLLLALEVQGISSCPINWPEVPKSEHEIRKLIKLEDYERVIMLIAVGYPDPVGGIPYSQKKNSSNLLKVIK